MSNPTAKSSASTSGFSLQGIGLSNTIHSEVAPCLPLPSLPVFCGASDPEIRLFDERGGGDSLWYLNQSEILAQSARIAHLLHETDVSYINLRNNARPMTPDYVIPLELHDQVLQCNPEAFEHSTPGKAQLSGNTAFETRPVLVETSIPVLLKVQNDDGTQNNLSSSKPKDIASSSRKPKAKKKDGENISVPVQLEPTDLPELQDAVIRNFCDLLEDFCGKAEVPSDEQEEVEWLALPASDIRLLVNEIMLLRGKKLLHLVPLEALVRLLRILDHQIHRAEGLSVYQCDRSDSDVVSYVFSALESINAALTVMAHNNMPKQLYKEEIIERILEFSKHQIMDILSAYDPTFRALHKPNEHETYEDDENEDHEADYTPSGKRRRVQKSVKLKKSAYNKVPSAMNAILQKLCTIIGLLKELLLTERLSDSCILQLVKTSFTTLLVDNVQLLQLKAIGLLGGIFYSYTQHRAYIVDEMVQLLWKLPVSKRALRAYHLPDEDQKQIQIVTALLIQLVHSSANLPEALRQASSGHSILEVSLDATYISKCHEAVTETCCLFWTRVLQRFTTVKAQDSSEMKVIMENLVTDLLTTLNLPEYPASAVILEVLCVMLLQNAGLNSKDVSGRSMAIDLLGMIATSLKHDAAICSQNKFWMLQASDGGDDANCSVQKDACIICSDRRAEKALFICQGCDRLFHADCMGAREHEVTRNWYCQICLCEKQLLVLQSFSKMQCKDKGRVSKSLSGKCPETSDTIVPKVEIIQQTLLNYLQDSVSADDIHHFICWFYLCLWYKDDSKSEQRLTYDLTRLKSNLVVRDSGTSHSTLTRDSFKKITRALGQNSSFARGFDKILHLLLASLRENSPIIRAKALRAVSIIVETDPGVLRDKRVQLAVEGRFCDSAISVREAALELVGRHIASHPDVGLQYFEKVAERIKDTGVSVRKRAIKIIRDMCTSSANFSQFTTACIQIISRVSDDESSIQDLVCKTFYEFWFEEPSCVQTTFSGDGSSVPLELAKKTDQLVEMLREMSSHYLLITVIKRNLALDFLPQSAKAAGINPMSLASVRKRCELMCKCILERILQVEEMNSTEEEVKTLPYVLALHSFCVVDPTLCVPSSDPSQFVVTLQPYLKTQVDNRVVAQFLENIIFIIDSALPLIKKLTPIVVEELEQDLKQMIVRHSFFTVVHACIKCLCTLSRVAGKGASVVEFLIQLFFKRLDAQAFENKQLVVRSLFCLGLLIRYGNPLIRELGGKNVDIVSSLSLFKKYLIMEDFSVKVRSLQALGFVLIASPEYMLERDIGKILEATLSPSSHVHMKMQALQNLYEYLLDEESQMGTDKTSNDVQNSVGAGQRVPVAAGAGDTNICGGIVQLYWDHILGRCLDFNDQVRQTALKIVEVVLRQGLVHPITCVPHLIALETDPLESNSKLAHHLLMNMNEKYPAFFESRLGDGLQLSFSFVHSLSGVSHENLNQVFPQKGAGSLKGKSEVSSLAQARLGVSRIYKLIRGNRVSRNKFMSSIIRKFDNPSRSDSVISFLMYCTEVLALLPFTFPDEPLYLVYSINRVIQVRAGALEANMKGLILHLSQRTARKAHRATELVHLEATQLHFQQVDKMDFNGVAHEEPVAQSLCSSLPSFDLNGMAKEEPPDHSAFTSIDPKTGYTKSVEPCSISEDDVKRIQVDCLSATALQLLLRLKRHLKIVYGLNDARCQAFMPNEAPKAGESLCRQNVAFDISETRTGLGSTYQDLVQGYQDLKKALKEDTVDYATYTANIKRKRPTPRKKTNRRVMAGDEGMEDDDEDDAQWTGGGRRLNGSSSSRRGRRR